MEKLPFSLELTASSLVNIIKSSTGLKVEQQTQDPLWDTDSEQILIQILTPKKNIVLGHFTIVESKESKIQSIQSNLRGILATEGLSDIVEKLKETMNKYNEINQKNKKGK